MNVSSRNTILHLFILLFFIIGCSGNNNDGYEIIETAISPDSTKKIIRYVKQSGAGFYSVNYPIQTALIDINDTLPIIGNLNQLNARSIEWISIDTILVWVDPHNTDKYDNVYDNYFNIHFKFCFKEYGYSQNFYFSSYIYNIVDSTITFKSGLKHFLFYLERKEITIPIEYLSVIYNNNNFEHLKVINDYSIKEKIQLNDHIYAQGNKKLLMRFIPNFINKEQKKRLSQIVYKLGSLGLTK